MSLERKLFVGAGKVLVAALAYATGSMGAGLLIGPLGLELPALPADADADAALQTGLLFLGGLAMSLGLVWLAAGLSGRWWQRWAVLSLFVLLVNGLGTVLEARIFTTLGSEGALFLLAAVAGVLSALVVSVSFRSSAGLPMGLRVQAFLARWKTPGVLWRLVAALLAFPVVYFAFGMIVAPHVMPYYEGLDFLVIPPMPTLLGVLLTRSALFLAASLAVIAAWSESRPRLILALGLGHFVAVGLVGLIQTTLFPAILRWIHGLEILADSMLYAWVLVWLFFPRSLAVRRAARTVEGTSRGAGAVGAGSV